MASIRVWLIALWLSAGGIVSAGCFAASADDEVRMVKREILALYDGGQEGDANLTRIHRYAELPLNHLGFILRFHDVRDTLPDMAEMERYRGVLTWFVGSLPDSDAYLAWASRVSRTSLRYVILGDIGVTVDSARLLTVNGLLKLAGVHHTGGSIGPTFETRVIQKDRILVEFECNLDPVLPDYPLVSDNGSKTRIGLKLEAPLRDGKRKAVPIAIGERGGYAALNYEFCHQRSPLYRGKWLLNPFSFFGAAFGADDQPIPDTTTATGNRLYFSQFDSAGWSRSSTIEGFRDSQATAGDVVLGELIEPFRDLPVTIDAPRTDVARSGRTAKQIETAMQRLLNNPVVDILQRRVRAGLSQFDTEFPSISNLSSLLSADKDPVMIAPFSDDSFYGSTGDKTGYAFSALKETVANTATPRRLKPISLSYHAYAGEFPGSLRAVRERLSEARLAPITPVSANRYFAIVDGFFNTRIDRIGSAAWRIANRGELQTIRFDAAEAREIDFESSSGIIGQKRNGAHLYVSLDPEIETAVVATRPVVPAGAARSRLFLVESRWLIRRVKIDACAVTFEAQGYGDGAFTWSNAADGRYIITVARGDREIVRQSAEADRAGQLQFVLSVGAIEPVTIKMDCASALPEGR